MLTDDFAGVQISGAPLDKQVVLLAEQSSLANSNSTVEELGAAAEELQ